ncbi:phosphate regulon sensor histidine kinase PhoR [Xylella fastidiosa subsp. multiplex]|uniref:Phosphate regulon sensor protein PhoR n=1 Tax=Xylella fastidiosa subsp. multiplex TaxID=644357 RepID=A0AAW6HSQ5_XYLFS|nr:phosphate regulon sensor histidine kinase PhoR [Xylella fastidiosa subsp. multiplex]MDC6407638.1 phosphate regulon sensor histidine kinase PhoR [Xylella fastidiosa subsp. multiplex]MDD0926343.1 phosphate regulon sensor histidine kinase PhoR [Xylella fastidiosa subsp. multiplex]MDD0935131.1 phosphate regulon sensor histidine kinase PhoR [Xylella fastidiosa subsp. multiplex]MSS69447.1 phosphate regulon sensor histidine kinase PhoR [Xylella fastidiosa subsp. multiplex]
MSIVSTLHRIRFAWFKTLGVLALILFAALLVGLLIGQVWVVLTLTALAEIAWQYWRLHQVLHQLAMRRRWTRSMDIGVWKQLDHLICRNQTDMRARVHRLLEMLRTYRAAAAALPDAVVVVDCNSQCIQWFNEAANTLLGLRYPSDLDRPVVERLQPLPLASWLTQGCNAESMLDVPSPVNPDVRLNLHLIPYFDDYLLLIARDVSKLLLLEQVKRDFVANVSHELRTPLTVVHGYLDMLDPDDFPDAAPMLDEMRKQSQRMTQLVEDLLTLSRLESQEELEQEQVAMVPMLATLHREAEAHSQGRHTIEVVDNAGCDLFGSNKDLHSAFSNLITNAVRYTPAGGSVRVCFQREDDGVVLMVCDTGYGIPTSHLPRITERFYRVSSSRSRERGGTGLGLSIVKHVLELHQARLDIISEVGKGSEFSCHFAAARVAMRESESESVPIPP